MSYELYNKVVGGHAFGHRIRKVASVTGMWRIAGDLWTALALKHHPSAHAAAPVAPAPAATITGLPAAPGGTAIIDLNFHSAPAAKAYTATVVVKLGAAADVTFTVPVASGATGNQFATTLAAAAGWPADLAAVKGTGAAVNVNNNHGADSLTKLTVAFA
jgi:hypothetical protein